jgi:hypothetical protein
MATPPSIDRRGEVRFLAPRDTEAGGTWIAVTERGLCLALLNGQVASPIAAERPYRSRGDLILDLLSVAGADHAMTRLSDLDLPAVRPFRLLAIDRCGPVRMARWEEGVLEIAPRLESAPPLTSSSFATEEVCGHRIRLYHESFPDGTEPTDAKLLAYHSSHLPERGARSVCMHRKDAGTLSLTWVEVGRRAAQMRYVPHAPCLGLHAGGGIELPLTAALP